MAHFAEIGADGIVLRVIVVNNKELLDEQGAEQEATGIAFCKALLGGEWVQTSYTSSFRKNFAGVGYTYDRDLDGFVPPKPYGSWTLDPQTCRWFPPSPRPLDGEYYWDEGSLSWLPAPLMEI